MNIESTVESFRRGEATPADLLERCLRRIAERDGHLQAWVHIDESGARATARESTSRWRDGHPRSTLDGIPVAVKDIVDWAGLPTHAGVPGWATEPAADDAPIMRRLRQLGAVIVGKTVTTPFACFDPPPTRHPQRSQCTPGGSSSGSAVAVADGQVAWALGSQTGGSITRPAGYCGVVGFKPTFGSWPLDGVFPISQHLDHVGYLCADASSARLIFEAVTGESVRVGEPQQIGDLRGVYQARADSAIASAHDSALSRLRDAGGRVVEVELPVTWAALLETHATIMAVEAAEAHRAWYDERRDSYPKRVAELIERGRRVPRADYLAAVEQQRAWQAQVDRWMESEGLAVLVMPSTPTTAPQDRTTTGDPAFNSPWSLLGLPTLTLPVGRAADGLPCGLQLIGRRGKDANLLGVGEWCQQRGVYGRCRPTLPI